MKKFPFFLFLFFAFNAFSLTPSFVGLVLTNQEEGDLTDLRGEKILLLGIDLPGGKKELQEHLALFWDEPLDKEKILQIKERIVEFYQAHERPFVHVQVPPQKIQSGILVCRVSEGVLGEVNVKGNTKDIVRHFRFKKNAPLNLGDLAEDLKWVNKNPFRKVRAVFTPSQHEGKADLELDLKEEAPFRIYTGMEDLNSFFSGVIWGAGLSGQLFSYQGNYGISKGSPYAHSFQYELPLPIRHTLIFSGGYSQQKTIGKALLSPLVQNAKAGIRYEMHDVSVGLLWKMTDLDFDWIREKTHLVQAMLGYHLMIEKRLNLSIDVFLSPPTFPTGTKAFMEAKKPNLYGTLSLSSAFPLWSGYTLKPSFYAQTSVHPLLFSEQMGIGGASSVRGYPERKHLGDQGMVINSELITPSWQLFSLFKERSKVKEGLNFLLFLDYGYARNVGGGNSLASFGGGLRYAFEPYFSLKMDLGFPFIGARAPVFHFRTFFSY